MGLLIEAAIAKTAKYASGESGDSAELIERPGGGLSVVLIDGQGSGQAARSLSLLLSAHAVGLIKEGVRDGAVARAVHDRLFAFRHGQVSATLDIVSVDLRTKTLVVARNAETPLLIGRSGAFDVAPCAGEPIGLYLRSRPAIWEVPLEAGLQAAVCTDGVSGAGLRHGLGDFDLVAFVGETLDPNRTAAELADALLIEAIRRDAGRPADDMTVVVAAVRSHEDGLPVRRQAASVPLP
jgi:serine phosphatase RsbU (regulator of sigma subunit)